MERQYPSHRTTAHHTKVLLHHKITDRHLPCARKTRMACAASVVSQPLRQLTSAKVGSSLRSCMRAIAASSSLLSWMKVVARFNISLTCDSGAYLWILHIAAEGGWKAPRATATKRFLCCETQVDAMLWVAALHNSSVCCCSRMKHFKLDWLDEAARAVRYALGSRVGHRLAHYQHVKSAVRLYQDCLQG